MYSAVFIIHQCLIHITIDEKELTCMHVLDRHDDKCIHYLYNHINCYVLLI